MSNLCHLECGERYSEMSSPTDLPCRVGDFVLAELDLDVGHASPHGMKRDAVIHGWIQIVRLIIPHRDVAWTPQSFQHGLHQAAVVMTGQRDLPRPGVSGETCRHGVN